jgi:hypothetical protein
VFGSFTAAREVDPVALRIIQVHSIRIGYFLLYAENPIMGRARTNIQHSTVTAHYAVYDVYTNCVTRIQ